MEKLELANAFVLEIKRASNKVQTVKNIIKQIDGLVYSDTKERIKDVEKKWLLEYIHSALASEQKSKNGLYYIEKSADNKYYLELISKTLALLNGGKK